MRKQLLAIGMSAVAAAWAAPAQAQVVDATEPDRLVEIIQALGYRAQLTTDEMGDPMINSSAAGTDFTILFFGCTDNTACRLLLFRVGYDLPEGTTLEAVNAWNTNEVVGRAYLDDENDPWLEMAVNMDGGVSRANFEDTFDWWDVTVAKFQQQIGF